MNNSNRIQNYCHNPSYFKYNSSNPSGGKNMFKLNISSFSFGFSLGLVICGLLLLIQDSSLAIDLGGNLSFGFVVLLIGALLETISYYRLKEEEKISKKSTQIS